MGTADSKAWKQEGLLSRWTLWTLVPVITIGLSGILVGFVTKMSGGVRKVLATITGLVLTCVLQHASALFVSNDANSIPLSATALAVPLVATGIYLHASFPPLDVAKKGE